MRTIPSTTLLLLAVVTAPCSAFAPHAGVPAAAVRTTTTTLQMAGRMTPTRKTRREDSFDRDSEEGKDEEGEDEMILDYSEAQGKLKDDDAARRVEEGLAVGLSKEDEDEYNSNKGMYSDMRAKIRARASEEGFEKSVATRAAIEEATQRAMAGTSSATADSMLDLSGFGEKFADDAADQLTDEEQAEIDAIASMPFYDQIKEELSNTRFPTPVAIFQTACVMALIFAVSATLILKGDAFIRDSYMGFGFIPRPDEIYDFNDLELPEGFVEQLNLESNLDIAVKEATGIANEILPPTL